MPPPVDPGGEGRGDRQDRGSVLMLMPAAVLVVLVLASIAVDMSLVHLRQRQAVDVAASAANDAATAGVDRDRLRAGEYVLDPDAATAVVEDAIARSRVAEHLAGPATVTVTEDTVEVTVEVTARHLFSGAIPGAPRHTTVRARATATAPEL